MRVQDIMSRPVYTMRPSDSIADAAALLADKKITAAPVVDGSGCLIGMVSEGDLMWHRVPADPTAHAQRLPEGAAQRPETVAEVMSPDPMSTHLRADVANVAELMLEHDVRSVPVVEDQVVVGIISRRDILRTVVRTDEVLAREVQHRLDEYAGGRRRWTATVHRGVATVDGSFDDDTESVIVTVMARTVPGVAAVKVTELAS